MSKTDDSFMINPMRHSTPAASMFRILATASSLGLVMFVSITQQVANDFWLQATVGELILKSHEIPRTLLFPFTEIHLAPFNAHEWFPSILFSLALRLLGEANLPLINGVLGCVIFVLASRLVYIKSVGNLPLALSFGLLAVLTENYRHVLRPELLSVILLILCLDRLHAVQLRQSTITAMVYCGLSAIWSNTHGSYVLAPMLSGAYWVGSLLDTRFKPGRLSIAPSASFFLFLTAASFVSSLANPFGLSQWDFVLHFSQASLSKNEIIEWIPTFDERVRHIRGVWIGCGVLAMSLALLWALRSKLSHSDVLIFMLFLALCLKANRFLIYAGIAASCTASAFERQFPRRTTHTLALVIGLTLLLWGMSLKFGNAAGTFPHTRPDQTKLTPTMVDALDHPSLQGNVYTSYALGAELIYRAYPRLRPSIDSRIDSYGDEYYYRHESLLRTNAAMQEFVVKYDVRYLLLDLADFQIVQDYKTLKFANWNIRVMDSKAILLERTSK